MEKYIVKNCPCYCEGTAIKGNEQLTQGCDSLHRTIKEGKRNLEKCCNINDCLVKQIVEKCRKEINSLDFNDRCFFAEYILTLLEIEKVNE